VLPVAILAGGLATRMRPMTETIPKILLPVNGTPFIMHQLRLLRSHGIERVVLCLGYLGEHVREWLGREPDLGIDVAYAFDGPALLGTGGALRRALPLLGANFFVLYGDSYLPCDYGAIERAYLASGKPALMSVFRNEGRWDTSNVEFAGGELIAYDKRKKTARMHYIDYGLGVLSADVIAALPGEQAVDLADVYTSLAESGDLAGYEVFERFYEIGSPAGLAELSEKFATELS